MKTGYFSTVFSFWWAMGHENSNFRRIKLLASATFVIISAFMAYPGFFGRRTRADEAVLAIDIYRLLREGQINEFIYENGQAFLAFIPTLLHVLGLPYSVTNVLSPFIAALCLSSMVSSLYFIYLEESGDWIGIVPIAIGFFPFAAFVGVLSETSHKAFIYTIVYLALYLFWRYYRNQYDRRQLYLLIVILCLLSFFNVYWAMIYSGIFIFALLIENMLRNQKNIWNSLLTLPIISVLFSIVFFPTISNVTAVLYVRIVRIFEKSANSPTTVGSTGGLISDWPTISIFHLELSTWFLYTVGVFIIGAISIASAFIGLYRLSNKNAGPLDRILLIIHPSMGLIMIGMLATGSLPAFRRLMVFPGMVGLLYWMIYLSKNRGPISSPNTHTIIAILTIIIICTSAFVAIPRLTPDGNGNPYDKFSDSSDFSRVSFALQDQSDCLITTGKHDTDIARIAFGKIPSFEQQSSSAPSSISDKVYSSDSEGGLYCRP